VKAFSAQVDEWILKSHAAMEAVVKESAQELFELSLTPVDKGGNMPVKTAFLRNSFNVTLNAPDLRVTYNDGSGLGAGLGDYAMTIAGADIGDTIYGMFTANYAGYVHYGTNGRAGRLFVDLAAQRWPMIVAGVAARLSRP
jgi:hypothetical protein